MSDDHAAILPTGVRISEDGRNLSLRGLGLALTVTADHCRGILDYGPASWLLDADHLSGLRAIFAALEEQERRR